MPKLMMTSVVIDGSTLPRLRPVTPSRPPRPSSARAVRSRAFAAEIQRELEGALFLVMTTDEVEALVEVDAEAEMQGEKDVDGRIEMTREGQERDRQVDGYIGQRRGLPKFQNGNE